jgi:hypothetical protein
VKEEISLAVGDYGTFVCSALSFIREKQSPLTYKARKNSPESNSLEEEILQLRKTMENLALQEQSLTSDLVVQISRLLDEKINEYMRKSKKS